MAQEFHYKDVAIKGSISAFVIQSISALIGFAMNVVVARLLRAEGYGLYSYAVSWASIAAILCCLGIDASALRFVPAYRANAQWTRLHGVIRWSVSTIAVVCLIVIALLEFAISQSHIESGKKTAIEIALLMVPAMSLLTLGQALLRGFRSVVQALLPNGILRPSIMILGSLILAYAFSSHADVRHFLLVLCVAVYLAMLYQYSRVLGFKRSIPKVETPEYQPGLWLSVSLPLVVMAALTTLLSQLDILMLGTLGSARQTGLYSAAARYATLASFALTASNIIVAPLISELYHTGKLQDLRRLVRFVMRWTALFSTAMALLFVLLGRPLLSIFGDEYPAAYGPALILLIGQVVNAITGPVGYLMVLTGRQFYALIVYLAACALNIAINLVAIPRLGMYGAAIGTAASVAVANIMMYWVANREVLRAGLNEGKS